jgi:DGQHR domain-containing protein
MEWAGTRRVGEHQRGTQRILKPSRVNAIHRFLKADTRNTIPVSIIIAFNEGVAVYKSLRKSLVKCLPKAKSLTAKSLNRIEGDLDFGSLSFKFDQNAREELMPALIVDGQHRLKGMSSIDDEDIPVLVVALIDASHEEQAFQFVVINNKATKVPTDNVKAILATVHEEELQERLLNAGVDYGNISATLKDINENEASPFRNLLDWPLTPQARVIDKKGVGKETLINLTAIESCLKYLRNQFTILDQDEDTLRDIFLAIWRVAKENYSDLWGVNDKFLSKVNIIAFNEFIVDKLVGAWENDMINLYEPVEIENQVKNIVRPIPQDFWTNEWTTKIQDNAVIRGLIKDNLRTIFQNDKAGISWYEKNTLIPSSEG